MAGPLRDRPGGKLTRLAFYLNRYGDELEADFQEVWSLNLGEMWRSGQYRRMLNLINHLPQASRFAAAVSNDPEHVEAILAATEGQPEPDTAPPLSEWSTQVEMLAKINDGINTVAAILVAANGGKPGKTPATRRPSTKFQEVREQKIASRHRALTKRVLKTHSQVE